MPSILVQSRTSARPMQIYMDVGVSLLRFKYPATLLKYTLLQMWWHKLHFPKLEFRTKYNLFHMQKIKFKKFYCHCYVVKLFLYFSWLIFPLFNVFLLFLAMWKIFIIFKVARIFLVILSSFLIRTLYDTWNSDYRRLQVLIMIFNPKTTGGSI